MKNRGVPPWLCAGDFNEILQQSEKEGGRDRPHNKMKPFRDVLDKCGFMDLGFVCFPFTWHKHYTGYKVWERLDWAVATNEWFSMFPGTQIHHLDVTTSDHKALWITPKGMDSSFPKPFHFEHMWLTNNGCSDTVEVVWKEPIIDPWETRVLQKVEKCGHELAWWTKKSFGNVKHELEKKKAVATSRKRGGQN